MSGVERIFKTSRENKITFLPWNHTTPSNVLLNLMHVIKKSQNPGHPGHTPVFGCFFGVSGVEIGVLRQPADPDIAGPIDFPGIRRLDAGDDPRTRAATPERPEMLARSPDLTVQTEAGFAFTNSPVEITQGQSWITGVGAEIDNNKSTFVLQSQVKGQYIRPKATP